MFSKIFGQSEKAKQTFFFRPNWRPVYGYFDSVADCAY